MMYSKKLISKAKIIIFFYFKRMTYKIFKWSRTCLVPALTSVTRALFSLGNFASHKFCLSPKIGKIRNSKMTQIDYHPS